MATTPREVASSLQQIHDISRELDRKLTQADALVSALCTYVKDSEDHKTLGNALWLLSDLLTVAAEAKEQLHDIATDLAKRMGGDA